MTTKHFDFLRWLPVAASVALVGLIIVISAMTVTELNQATRWRKQTFRAVLEAQAYEDNLVNAQNDIRRYTAAGNSSLLIEYQNDTNAELREFNRLVELTQADPAQQQRLKELDAAIKAVFAFDNRVIGVYARQGREAAVRLESQDAAVLDPAIRELEQFKADEETLLDRRDAAEQQEYHRAAEWLIAGSILAAVFLVVANYIVGREIGRRRRAVARQQELIAELQQALAEVKTLSGLIPICSWCKQVRSDKGFWQTVEQYVSSRTDATFTHGMCPSCLKKWEADMAKTGPGTTP